MHHRDAAAHRALNPRDGRFERRSAIDRFNLVVRAPLTRLVWLHAGAGAGKTTLVEHWLARRGRSTTAVWLPLDPVVGDAAGLIASVQDVATAALGARAPALPRVTREQIGAPAMVMRRGVRALFAALPTDACWVVDDVHRAPPALVDPLVVALAEECRPGQRVIVLSRAAPPAALARLRLDGKAAVADAALLAWSPDEVAQWLAACGRDPAAAGAIVAATGGWTAAVMLAVRHGASSGAQALLHDYIAHEVIAALDAADRRLLVATAWLPTVDAAAAEALAAVTDAPQRFEQLVRGGMLVDSELHAAQPRWRVHELLRAQLQEDPAARAGLAACARWLDTQGQSAAALQCWLHPRNPAPRRFAEADALLCRIAPQWLAASRHLALRDAARAIPDAQRSGELCLRLAQAEVVLSPAAGRALADQALARLPAGAIDLRVQCHALAIASYFQAFDDTQPLAAHVDALEALGVTAERHAASGDQRAAVAVAVWSALFLREPSHPATAGWHARVRAVMHEPVDPNVKLRAAMLLAKRAWYHGRYVDIAPLPAAAATEVTRPGVAPYARLVAAMVRQYGAWAAADWGGGADATAVALSDAEVSGIALLDQHLRLHCACFESLRGDAAAVDRLLARVAERADPSRRMEAWHHHTVRGWIALRRGRWDEADAAARLAADAAQVMGPGPLAMALAVRAHALGATGDVAALQPVRATLEAIAHGTDNVLAHVHVLLVDAATAHALGDADGATDRVTRALAGVRVNALWAPMGVDPAALARLLAFAFDVGIETEAARRMVAAMRLAAPAGAGGSWPWAVRVRALGRFAIEVDGEPLVASGKAPRRSLELLQALIACGGRSPATRLADLLWPDAEGDLALDALEATLRRLRKLLCHPEAVQLTGGVLALNPGCVWVDALARRTQDAEFLPEQDAAWALVARARLARGATLTR